MNQNFDSQPVDHPTAINFFRLRSSRF
jgi:hypothetical protein